VRLLQEGAMASNVADNEKLTLFLRKKCQQLVYWLPMLSRARKNVVLVELLRFYKKCDHYS
jgi:hypothetical protein